MAEESRDNTAPSEGTENNSEESAISRITNLPIVTSALTSVSNAYQWTKDSNSLIGYSLDVAEKSVAMAAYTAQPVVNCLERPISAVNSMANQSLDRLEEKVPLITEPADQVVKSLKESAWMAVEQSKATGTQKMNDLMSTRVGQVVTSTVDAALTLSEKAVDYYLPEDKGVDAKDTDEGVEDDGDEEDDEDEASKAVTEEGTGTKSKQPFSNSVNKASKVSNKVRRRLYYKALVNIQYAQKRSQETLQKLHFTVDLIQYAKENIDTANSSIRTRVDQTQQNLWNTWNDWTLDKDGQANDEDVEDKTGEQKTLAIARNLTRRLRVLTNNLSGSIRVLPKSLHKSVEEARGTVEMLFKTFEEAQYFKDLPSSILSTAKDGLVRMSQGSVALADYLVNSPAMQWLVPEINIDELEFDFEMDLEEEEPIVCNHVGHLPTGN